MIPRKHGKTKSFSLKTTFIRKKGKDIKSFPITVSPRGTVYNPPSEDSANVPSCFENIDCPPEQDLSSYERRKIAVDVNWSALTDSLVDTAISMTGFVQDHPCTWCSIKPWTMRCFECSPNAYFCDDCAILLHTKINYFYLVEKWEVCIH